MAVITVSSSFGTGGSVVAAGIATKLGWQIHHRTITAEMAKHLSVPTEVALANDEWIVGRLRRTFTRFAVTLGPEAATNLPPEVFADEDAFKSRIEMIIRRLAAESNSVIVGRAAAFILQEHPAALHVRLDGPAQRRQRQAMAALNLSGDEALRQLVQTDTARALYVRHFYHADWRDLTAYHFVVDSTSLPLPTCVQLVVEAAKARFSDIAAELCVN